LRSWLRQLRARGIAYCGVDGGPWVLARAGLLNGHRATTHWEDLEAFANAFPEVDPLPDRYVIDGPALTTGGAAPCLDLMLHLIRSHHGAELAGLVANALLYDPEDRPSPQRLVPQARLAALTPQVARAVSIMEARLEDPPAIADIAAEVGLSPRRLEMLFRKHLETGPGAFFLRLRLNEARRLALDTGLNVQDIAIRTGFSGPSTLARAFRKAFGQSISDLRAER
jgi:transcriptional regulator GlxA family with amidase domain